MTFDGRPQFSALVVGRASALRVEGQRPTPAPPLWPSAFDSLRFNIFDTLPTATAPLRTVTGSETGGVLRWDLDAVTTNLDLGGVARRRFKWAAYGIADSTTHLLAIGDLDIFESGDPTPAVPPDPPVSGGDVLSFTIAPLGGFVFYRGDILTDGRYELFRTRIAGASSVDIRVSGPLVAGGALTSAWAALPDGRQVVYSADQEVDEQQDLYVGDICLLCDGFEDGDSGRWD